MVGVNLRSSDCPRRGKIAAVENLVCDDPEDSSTLSVNEKDRGHASRLGFCIKYGVCDWCWCIGRFVMDVRECEPLGA